MVWPQSSTDPTTPGMFSQDLTHEIGRPESCPRHSPNAGTAAEVALAQPLPQGASIWWSVVGGRWSGQDMLESTTVYPAVLRKCPYGANLILDLNFFYINPKFPQEYKNHT